MIDKTIAHIDLNHLRALHVLLDEASVTRAATRLGITPPAASNALRRLRVLLNDPLLVRSGQAMVRTPKGEALRGPAARFVEAAASIVQPLVFDPSTWTGTFPLLTSDYVYSVLACPLEQLLAQHLPGVRLTVTHPSGGDTTWLDQHDGLVISPFPSDAPGATLDHLFDEGLVVAMRTGHPAAEGELTLDRYCQLNHLLVSLRGRPGSIVDSQLEAMNLERSVSRVVPSFFAAANLLADSNLVSALPSRFVAAVCDRFGLVTRKLPVNTYPIGFWVSGHRRHASSALHRLMRDLIVRAAAG